jgi:hypothetical protein
MFLRNFKTMTVISCLFAFFVVLDALFNHLQNGCDQNCKMKILQNLIQYGTLNELADIVNSVSWPA